jgi:hypothetical protein
MAFSSLPIEVFGFSPRNYSLDMLTYRQLNKAIAHELETDKDITTYRLICRSTNDAIDADKCSFWRAKFREKFALTQGVNNKTLKRSYQLRAKLLRRGTGYDFFRGHRRREADVVSVLRDLIVGESSTCDMLHGPVLYHLQHGWDLNANILQSPSRARPNSMNTAVHVVRIRLN